jgi:hypothetical protein
MVDQARMLTGTIFRRRASQSTFPAAILSVETMREC